MDFTIAMICLPKHSKDFLGMVRDKIDQSSNGKITGRPIRLTNEHAGTNKTLLPFIYGKTKPFYNLT